MNTLASILAGAGGNPYQGAGGGIAPLLQQALLARQLGNPQMGQSAAMPNPQMPPAPPPPGLLNNPQYTGQVPPLPGMGANPQIGSLADLALPGIATGAY
jgi:hypothetical protein